MKKIWALLLLLLFPALLVIRRSLSSQERPLVLQSATVIDATGAPPRPDITVVIAKGRITALGRAGDVRVPEGAQVVDAGGKFLIPGLWDMHVHGATVGTFPTLFIANGVTGVRDMGFPLSQINPLRQKMKEGTLVGPRIIAAGLIADGPKPVWPPAVSMAVGDEAGGRRAVAVLKKDGADFVKVYSLLPRGTYFAVAEEAKQQGLPFAGHVPIAVSLAEVSDAGQGSVEHLDGLWLACSAREAEVRKEFVEAAGKSEPGAFLALQLRAETKSLDAYSEEKSRALFTRLAKNRTWQCPTLTVLRATAFLDDDHFTGDARFQYLPSYFKPLWDPKQGARIKKALDEASRRMVELYEHLTPEDLRHEKIKYRKYLAAVGAMRRAGVEFLAGTDTPSPYCFPGFSLHDELALLVEAGLTPMEALQAATSNPARFAGLLDSLGTVEQGKVADLVLLDADPLRDIRHTRKIHAVVVGGKLLAKSELEGMLARAADANRR